MTAWILARGKCGGEREPPPDPSALNLHYRNIKNCLKIISNSINIESCIFDSGLVITAEATWNYFYNKLIM